MKRLTIFAFYNRKNIIPAYVFQYLFYLKEVSNRIIFIADNNPPSLQQQEQLNKLVDYAEFGRHNEYDFGSYKKGYLYAIANNWLQDIDELILCNDSCFCLNSLHPIFAQMSLPNPDFWSITANNNYQEHLQSYFLVFNKSVFSSNIFHQYLTSIKPKHSFYEIITEYEIPLKSLLESNGFNGKSYVPIFNHDNPCRYPLTCLQYGSPLIKRKIFSEYSYSRQPILKILYILFKSDKYAFCNAISLLVLTRLKIISKKIYQSKITKSGNLSIKICGINIFSKKLSERKIL